MANFKHIGKDFIPHDVVAKVTGAAKYAEDFRADGMVFCKLLTSPMPHARVQNIDAAEALKMQGVLGMMTADDIPGEPPGFAPVADEGATVRRRADPRDRRGLRADRRRCHRAHQDRLRAAALHLRSTGEPVPRRPGRPQRWLNIGTLQGLNPASIKWSAADFAKVKQGEGCRWESPPRNGTSVTSTRSSQRCKVVYEERFVTASLSHHSMEPRSCMSYWQNGKCFVHGSLQSQSFAVPGLPG